MSLQVGVLWADGESPGVKPETQEFKFRLCHPAAHGLALGSPIFPSGCEGKLGVALESLQGRRDLT